MRLCKIVCLDKSPANRSHHANGQTSGRGDANDDNESTMATADAADVLVAGQRLRAEGKNS